MNARRQKNKRFLLLSVHEGCQPVRMGRFDSALEAKRHVESLDENGQWPEGSEVGLEDTETGLRWFLDDEWQPL